MSNEFKERINLRIDKEKNGGIKSMIEDRPLVEAMRQIKEDRAKASGRRTRFSMTREERHNAGNARKALMEAMRLDPYLVNEGLRHQWDVPYAESINARSSNEYMSVDSESSRGGGLFGLVGMIEPPINGGISFKIPFFGPSLDPRRCLGVCCNMPQECWEAMRQCSVCFGIFNEASIVKDSICGHCCDEMIERCKEIIDDGL